MLIHIGYGNFVQLEWISDVISAENADVKRMIAGAREDGLLINATAGRALRSVIILKSGPCNILCSETGNSLRADKKSNLCK